MLDVWYLLRRKGICSSWVTGRLFLEVCFRYSFLVDVELNQSTSYATNFGFWFFRISIWWAFFLAWGLSSTSLFLIFNVDDKKDDVLEAADIDNKDDAKKKVHQQSGRHFWSGGRQRRRFQHQQSYTFWWIQFFSRFCHWLTILLVHYNHLFWCGHVCLRHGLLNERLLEMRMFGVWGGGMPFLFAANRGYLRGSLCLNSYVLLPPGRKTDGFLPLDLGKEKKLCLWFVLYHTFFLCDT